MAVTVGVAPRIRPVHSAISPTSVVPSSAMYSGRNGITSVKPVKPMQPAPAAASMFRRLCRASNRVNGSVPSVPSVAQLEANLNRRTGIDLNAVDEPHAVRCRLHHQRAGADAGAEEADALQERAVGDTRGCKDDVVAAGE